MKYLDSRGQSYNCIFSSVLYANVFIQYRSGPEPLGLYKISNLYGLLMTYLYGFCKKGVV